MRRALLCLLAASLTWGCPPKRIDFGSAGRIEDPARLLELADRAERRVLTLNAEARLRIDSPRDRGTVSMFAAVSRPELLHLEPLDFFGRPRGVLVVQGGRFGLYSADEGKYYLGPASPENVSRFLPVVLPAHELVMVMLGQAPRLPHDDLTLTLDEAERVYVLTLSRGTIRQVLWIDPRHHRVRKSQLEGIAAYDLEFADFAEQGEVVFPRKVKLSAKEARTELELTYSEFTLNQPPDLTLFEIEPPEDVPVVPVDSRGFPSGAAPEEEAPKR
jgi:hypothetical protein